MGYEFTDETTSLRFKTTGSDGTGIKFFRPFYRFGHYSPPLPDQVDFVIAANQTTGYTQFNFSGLAGLVKTLLYAQTGSASASQVGTTVTAVGGSEVQFGTLGLTGAYTTQMACKGSVTCDNNGLQFNDYKSCELNFYKGRLYSASVDSVLTVTNTYTHTVNSHATDPFFNTARSTDCIVTVEELASSVQWYPTESLFYVNYHDYNFNFDRFGHLDSISTSNQQVITYSRS